MFHPLIQSLIDHQGFSLVEETTLPALAACENAMLFVAGDPGRIPEALDVAVAAPEIIKVFRGQLTGFVASHTAEPYFQTMLGLHILPALVFLRRGAYLGTIARMRDWPDYGVEIGRILALQPSTPPDYKQPLRRAAPTQPSMAGSSL